jgi:ribose transport system ATP-binding protein
MNALLPPNMGAMRTGGDELVMTGAPVHADGSGVLLSGVSKRFGAVAALSDVNLALAPGLVHAFVGQNGAGKSTCLGIVAGRIAPSAGAVSVQGTHWSASMTPQAARRAGVSTIYQELTIVPAMTALDNVFLGSVQSRFGMVADGALRRRFRELSARLSVNVDPAARAGDLSLADQQMLEIMRALSVECRVLLLDEPTAALSEHERASLFSVMRELKARGVTLIFVSHYLDEVEANSDTVTVFRDGRVIESAPVAAWTRPRMIKAMLGAELEALERAVGHSDRATTSIRRRRNVNGPPSGGLEVESLTSRDGIRDVSMRMNAGEIVGLAGLVGSGRTSLIHALAGVAEGVTGRMWMDGREVAPPRTPRDALNQGICLIPEDRKGSGLFMTMSSRENVMLTNLERASRLGLVRRSKMRRLSEALGRDYGIDPSVLDRPAGQLSGGNQQKLLLARSGNREPRVLLADEATRGIDVGAKSVVLETLRGLADEGLAVLFVSSELEEVAAVSDRVYVLRDGRIVAHFDERFSEDALLEAAFGSEVTAGV